MNIVSKSLIVLTGLVSMATFVSPAAHATTQPACINGDVRSNLVITWKSAKSVTVGTVANKPLCKDTTIFFSSYTMPDNYNGKPFAGNPTASPQTVFDSTSVVLKQGATQPVAMTITLPEACKNVQVDTYYAPEITTVTAAGHGSQYISGKIIGKTVDSCTPQTPTAPVTPVVPPAEAETPSTPAPVVVVPAETPAELPHTGNSFTTTLLSGAALSVVTYAAMYVGLNRR